MVYITDTHSISFICTLDCQRLTKAGVATTATCILLQHVQCTTTTICMY